MLDGKEFSAVHPVGSVFEHHGNQSRVLALLVVQSPVLHLQRRETMQTFHLWYETAPLAFTFLSTTTGHSIDASYLSTLQSLLN